LTLICFQIWQETTQMEEAVAGDMSDVLMECQLGICERPGHVQQLMA